MKLREAEKRLDGTVATCAAVPGRAPYVRSESWGRGDNGMEKIFEEAVAKLVQICWEEK